MVPREKIEKMECDIIMLKDVVGQLEARIEQAEQRLDDLED